VLVVEEEGVVLVLLPPKNGSFKNPHTLLLLLLGVLSVGDLWSAMAISQHVERCRFAGGFSQGKWRERGSCGEGSKVGLGGERWKKVVDGGMDLEGGFNWVLLFGFMSKSIP
jgi:hypothetical protein